MENRERVPARYRAHPQTAAILDALLSKATEIAKYSDELLAQCYISTATWSLELWEEKYGITPDPTKPLSERRDAIRAQMIALGTTTEEVICTLATDMTGYSAVVEVDYGRGFTVHFVQSGGSTRLITIDREALAAAVERIKPAHLQFVIQGITWDDIEALALKWQYFYDYPTTWDTFEYAVPLRSA